jgi:serine/threonine protein kinase
MGRALLSSASDGRLVVVKLIRETFAEDDGFRERFRREVAASRRLSGAYTPPVIDADPDASTPWLASAFVAGLSLQHVVEESGVLSEESVLRLAAGLTAALTEVHRAGLVHRDLKPSNVLMTEDGLRVIDFGIALATDCDTAASRLTHTGWLVGSPQYMSPEQAEGRELTPASDVFSLGSLLVMACTGESPFAGSSPPQTLYRLVHTDPDLSAVPTEVRRIAAVCLAKKPDERPDLNRLCEMIGDIPSSARPWPGRVHQLIGDQRAEIARVLDPTDDLTGDSAVGTPTMAATRLQSVPPFEVDDRPGIDTGDGHPVDPESWRNSRTDQTPFTEDALLPPRFTTEKAIEFVRVAGGAHPCDEQVATGPGPLDPSEMVQDLTSRGCTQVMTGVYLEQPGPNTTTEDPVLVSVTVFAFADKATASDAYSYLNGPARWNLTIWCARTGMGSKPWIAGPDGAGFRSSWNRVYYRYVIAAVAHRTDLSYDADIQPWLDSAVFEAANSSGPQNYRSG